MITVPEVVEELVKQSPFLEEGLALGIINYSALARQLQPQIREKLYKDIREGAIVMALKRLSGKLQSRQAPASSLLHKLSDITVRSNLIEFTFTNSPTLVEKQCRLLTEAAQEKGAFLTFTHGVFETTLIVSAGLEKEAERVFTGENLRSKIADLSSITLILPRESVSQAGVYYQILKSLAWEGISFTEVVSSLTELTVILENSQVDRAFSVLKNLSRR